MAEFPTLLKGEHEDIFNEPATYWYEGPCPQQGTLLRLPRTPFVEAIAHELMQALARDGQYSQEGKMYGVLLVETPAGQRQVLQAFSGLLNGESHVMGWVPPIAGREQVAADEARTLAQLDAIKQELLELKHLPARQSYETLSQTFQTRLETLAYQHQERKQERQQQRQVLLETLAGEALAIALTALDDQSRRDGMERRHLKRERDEALRSLHTLLDQADARIRELKRERKLLSQRLQAQMHAAYCLTNFAGQSLSLEQVVFTGGIPTGTGECCAPKLLHHAAMQGFKPLAMAEFWWGPSPANGDKVQGEFYGACEERCQPIMGFLLSGLSEPYQPASPNDPIAPGEPFLLPELETVYEDDWLIAINKPAGLLSVPGRTSDRQDSALTRLRRSLGSHLMPVHRLDQDTSGILLFARDMATYRHLSHQFQQRQVRKVYEALLAGVPQGTRTLIELPLWADPGDRPYQKVDWTRGKPSLTKVAVLAQGETTTRVQLIPYTGRTHQLRVHMAHPEGMGVPIVGDRLYGTAHPGQRLHLHARELSFHHPHRLNWVVTVANPEF